MAQAVNSTPEGPSPFGETRISPETTVPGPSPVEAPANPERSVERGSDRVHEKYAEILSKVTPKPVSAVVAMEGEVSVDAKAVYGEVDAEARVTRLLSLADAKGPEHAVRVAMKINDFYVLDRIHDELPERFYDALVAKGTIKG